MRAYNNKKKPERRTDAARIERILSRWSFSDAKVQHVFNKALRAATKTPWRRALSKKAGTRAASIAGSAAIDAGISRPSRDSALLHALGLEHRNRRGRPEEIDEGLGGLGLLCRCADAGGKHHLALQFGGQRPGELGAGDGKDFADQIEGALPSTTFRATPPERVSRMVF
jgi:hypothetical protein